MSNRSSEQHLRQTFPSSEAEASDSDVYIVSDLHLGPGLQHRSVRHSRLESFFYDDAFARFIDHVLETQTHSGRKALLILGGDVLDFLVVTDIPTGMEARKMGFQLTRDTRRFGLDSQPKHAEWRLRRIARGHPLFFRALGKFLASGHRIVVVTGNHDADLYWVRVRETLFGMLIDEAVSFRADLDPSSVGERIIFRQWFYREADRFYFEHGNQYEASNSVRYNLCPLQPSKSGKKPRRLDLPVGSLFVRYLVNEARTRSSYFYNLLSMEEYMAALARMNLIEMIGVLIRRLPFFFRALKAARLFESSAWDKIKQRHQQKLHEVADREGLSVAAVEKLQSLRAMPEGMTKYHLAMSMLKPLVVKVAKYASFAVLGFFFWFLVFAVIQSTPWLAESLVGKASLTALLAVFTILAVLFFLNRFTSRLRDIPEAATPDPYSRAQRIADLMEVKHVVMGHTHLADLRPLTQTGGFYANAGTWTALSASLDFLQPRSRRFCFVRIRGSDLELLRWNDEASRFDPVLVFEEYRPSAADVLFPSDPVQNTAQRKKAASITQTLDRKPWDTS